MVLAVALALSVHPHPAAQQPPNVREAAKRAGFGQFAGELEKASRPVVLFHPAKPGRTPNQLGTSRLGSVPDLPVGTAWPRCKGRPQTFLAQVRLSDVPAPELRRLGGTLLFFTIVDTEEDYGVWAGECSAVV